MLPRWKENLLIAGAAGFAVVGTLIARDPASRLLGFTILGFAAACGMMGLWRRASTPVRGAFGAAFAACGAGLMSAAWLRDDPGMPQEGVAWGLGGTMFAFGLVAAFDAARPRTPAPSSIVVDDEGVRVAHGADVQQVAWRELRRVEIVTTSAGPRGEDLFWVLEGRGSGCVVPNEDAVRLRLLPRLQRLPGFDNAKVIAASSCAEDAHFVCWVAPGK